MFDVQLLIGGQRRRGSSQATFERRNPLSEQVVSRVAAASVADAVEAVENAAAAFVEWSRKGPGARRALLLKAAAVLEAKTPQFIEAVSAETGASALWGGFNVHLAAGMLQEAAALTPSAPSCGKDAPTPS